MTNKILFCASQYFFFGSYHIANTVWIIEYQADSIRNTMNINNHFINILLWYNLCIDIFSTDLTQRYNA